jgi:hypothetical protein
MKYNIFQGSKLIQDTIAESLGYESNQKHSWFTKDMYFESFFYLSKRFGPPKIFDDYKDGGNWCFNIKQYQITISLNSSWVTFMVFGDYKLSNQFTHHPYWVKLRREQLKKSDLLITHLDNPSKRSKYETEQIQKLLDGFQEKNNIPDDITNEDFIEKYGCDFWIDEINGFNNKILNVNFEEYEKYGEYSNSGTRHALRTLRQFIQNMLTPIWVRDCPFNIKGRMSDQEAYFFERYKNNVKIKLI